jgi:phosphohistidine phosphatase
MKLLLVQHAEAFAKNEYLDRPLTEKGAQQVMEVTCFLKPMRLRVHAAWHSGMTRALQTAKVICTAVCCPGEAEAHEGLYPDDDPVPIADEIESREQDLLIVGHLPFQEKLAALLLTGSEEVSPIRFRNASVICLEKNPDNLWQIAWMITPELLEAAAANTAPAC